MNTDFDMVFDREMFSDFIDKSESMIIIYGIKAFVVLIVGLMASIYASITYGAMMPLIIMNIWLVLICFCLMFVFTAALRRDIARESYASIERIEDLSEKVDRLDNESTVCTNPDSDELYTDVGDLSGVCEEQAIQLRRNGYNTVYDVYKTDRFELSSVESVSNALTARMKADAAHRIEGDSL